MYYNLKIVNSGRDRIEIYYSKDYAIEHCVNKPKGKRKKKIYDNKEQEEAAKKKNRISNLNNSRNKIARLIACNQDLDIFITLTYSYQVDMRDSKRALNNFFSKLRKKQKNLKYLWVLEFQGNGNIHYHVLTNLNIEIDTTKYRKSEQHKKVERDFANKYWNHGFVDIRSLKGEGNSNVAKYLTAYITKDMMDKDLNGSRIYGYSNKTMYKPITTKILESKDQDEILQLFKDYDIQYSNSYSIGFKGVGKMNYFDMVKKNENKNDT